MKGPGCTVSTGAAASRVSDQRSALSGSRTGLGRRSLQLEPVEPDQGPPDALENALIANGPALVFNIVGIEAQPDGPNQIVNGVANWSVRGTEVGTFVGYVGFEDRLPPIDVDLAWEYDSPILPAITRRQSSAEFSRMQPLAIAVKVEDRLPTLREVLAGLSHQFSISSGGPPLRRQSDTTTIPRSSSALSVGFGEAAASGSAEI